MSGKHITKTQKRDYMTYRKNGNTQKIAAAKKRIAELEELIKLWEMNENKLD